MLNGKGGTGSSSSSGGDEGGLNSQLSPHRPNKKARVAEAAVNDENNSSSINQPASVLEHAQAPTSVDLRPLVIDAIQSLSAENPDDGIPKRSLLQRLGGHGESVEGVDAVLEELANEAKIYIEDSGGDEVIQTLQA